MDVIFHTIGLCPDSVTHYDLLDFILLQFNEFKTIIFPIKYKFIK